MNKINYVTGDATAPQGEGKKLIIHVCNDIGAWGAGFVIALSKKNPEPENRYRALEHYELGTIQVVEFDQDTYVVNMIGQHGVGPDEEGNPPVRYVAIMQCLEHVNRVAEAMSATVHCPRFGSGLAGGDWNLIEKLIEETIAVPVTVYDLP